MFFSIQLMKLLSSSGPISYAVFECSVAGEFESTTKFSIYIHEIRCEEFLPDLESRTQEFWFPLDSACGNINEPSNQHMIQSVGIQSVGIQSVGTQSICWIPQMQKQRFVTISTLCFHHWASSVSCFYSLYTEYKSQFLALLGHRRRISSSVWTES